MKKYNLIFLLMICFATLFAQNESIHYDTHPKFPHHATAEEKLMIPFLSQQAHLRNTNPPTAPVTAVAEFQPMGGVMIAYPLGIPVTLVSELSHITQVKVLVNDASDSADAAQYFTNNNVTMGNVEFWMINHDSYWTRDYGPWFVIDGYDSVNVIDFIYNRPQRPYDDAAMEYIVDYLGVNRYEMPMMHTGGNYMVDGYGTAASTILVLQENPSETEASLSAMAQSYLGVDNYMFLPDPLGEYIAHIDCWGKFLDVDKVLIAKVPANDPRYNNYESVAQTFAESITPWGNHYQVYRVDANPNANKATPYTNSLILNDHVFLPIAGNSLDNAAIATYQQAMPGYTIVPIMQSNYTPWYSTDALHCRTHELADLGMLYLKHYPLLGSKTPADDLTVSVTIKALSGASLITDSLLVYYRINNGEWLSSTLNHVSDNEYAFSFASINTVFENGDSIQYYIYAKDASGRCEKHPYIGAADPHVFVIDGVGVNDYEPLHVRVYPNPATDFVLIQGENLADVTVYDMMGRQVDYFSLSGNNVEKISCHQWNNGVYFLHIRDNQNRTVVQKLVIHR
ncbi:MAG: agmatine deiminase family protein [Bacteroidales bacterium]|nr:agmatine deiminase family protein [Bacteroidales bacterium]